MNRKILLVIALVIAFVATGYFIFTQNSSKNVGRNSNIRAGLDFKIYVSDQGIKKTIDCDICSYQINDEVYFESRTVSAQEGYVDIVFLKKNETRREAEPKINYQNILSSNEQSFSVDFYQIFRIKKSQNVSLAGKNISVQLINVTGLGCPEGSQC